MAQSTTVRTGTTKRQEVWNTRNGVVQKTAVRQPNGTFHGATNFREIRA